MCDRALPHSMHHKVIDVIVDVVIHSGLAEVAGEHTVGRVSHVLDPLVPKEVVLEVREVRGQRAWQVRYVVLMND